MSSQIKHNGAQYKMTARFTIFAGLLSFMVDKVNVFHQGGAMVRSDAYKKQMALKSLRHCSDDEQFGELFPELKQEIDGKLAENPEKYAAADNKLVAAENVKYFMFYTALVFFVSSYLLLNSKLRLLYRTSCLCTTSSTLCCFCLQRLVQLAL